MGILNKTQIEQLIDQGELVRYPRRKEGALDIQPDSYDLTAGKAIWKNSVGDVSPPLLYDPCLPTEKQQTHTVRPGDADPRVPAVAGARRRRQSPRLGPTHGN